MKRLVLAILALLCALSPALAAEADLAKPPKGAIILFDGSDTSKWARAKVTDDSCLMAGAATRDKFQDFILHLEFNMLPHPEGKRVSGNSGVYLQRRYEIQIINSHGRKPSRGGCGAIYGIKAIDHNVVKPLGEWQSYHITFRAPRWDGDKKIENARISLVFNGVKVHDSVEVPRKTGSGRPESPQQGPIYLQHHGNKVVFRNIWLLPLKP